jgi:type VI protein secretion system component Hcp
MSKLYLRLACLCFVVLFGARLLPAQNAGITLNSTEIGCSEKTDTGGIALSEWSWGADVPNPPKSVAFQLAQFSVKKKFDECSIPLYKLYTRAHKFHSISIRQTKIVRGTPEVVALIDLTDAYLASYQMAGAATDTTPPAETWTLSFKQMCVTTWTDNADGTLGPAQKICRP